MSAIDDLADAQNAPDPIAAAEQLAAMLALDDVGVQIRGARITGQGSRASVQIQLSNGEELEFDSIRDMVRPQNLVAEVVACTGACPTIKPMQAIRAAALTRTLAERLQSVTADDIARGWAIEYLQGVSVLDVDMNDQGGRWAMFHHLSTVDPATKQAQEGGSLATAGIVLRHADGVVLVRTRWFREFVRHEQDHTVSPPQVLQRMQRVGWEIRGNEGRIKATRPGNPGTLVWAFYAVPANWQAVTR